MIRFSDFNPSAYDDGRGRLNMIWDAKEWLANEKAGTVLDTIAVIGAYQAGRSLTGGFERLTGRNQSGYVRPWLSSAKECLMFPYNWYQKTRNLGDLIQNSANLAWIPTSWVMHHVGPQALSHGITQWFVNLTLPRVAGTSFLRPFIEKGLPSVSLLRGFVPEKLSANAHTAWHVIYGGAYYTGKIVMSPYVLTRDFLRYITSTSTSYCSEDAARHYFYQLGGAVADFTHQPVQSLVNAYYGMVDQAQSALIKTAEGVTCFAENSARQCLSSGWDATQPARQTLLDTLGSLLSGGLGLAKAGANFIGNHIWDAADGVSQTYTNGWIPPKAVMLGSVVAAGATTYVCTKAYYNLFPHITNTIHNYYYRNQQAPANNAGAAPANNAGANHNP